MAEWCKGEEKKNNSRVLYLSWLVTVTCMLERVRWFTSFWLVHFSLCVEICHGSIEEAQKIPPKIVGVQLSVQNIVHFSSTFLLLFSECVYLYMWWTLLKMCIMTDRRRDVCHYREWHFVTAGTFHEAQRIFSILLRRDRERERERVHERQKCGSEQFVSNWVFLIVTEAAFFF